jgi:hypothetical protein
MLTDLNSFVAMNTLYAKYFTEPELEAWNRCNIVTCRSTKKLTDQEAA